MGTVLIDNYGDNSTQLSWYINVDLKPCNVLFESLQKLDKLVEFLKKYGDNSINPDRYS